MARSSIQIDLDDPRTAKIADVISNKTCKKILGVLADKDYTEGDLAKKINSPINTVEYNLKKLIQAGLIEKTKEYFWSVKGKKIPVYRISNKRIIITPKTMIKGVIPAVIVAGVISLGLGIWSFTNKMMLRTSMTAESSQEISAPRIGDAAAEAGTVVSEGASSAGTVASESVTVATETASFTSTLLSAAWFWFLSGALVALIIFLLWNYFRNKENLFK